MLLPFISLKVNVTHQNRCHFSLFFFFLKQLEKASSVCVCVHDCVQSWLGLVADGIKGTYNRSVFHRGIQRLRTVAVSREDRRGFYKPTAFRTNSFKHYSQGWISFSLTDLRIFKWFRQSAAFFFWILRYEGFLAPLAMIVLNILLLLSFSFKTGISTVKHFNLLTIRSVICSPFSLVFPSFLLRLRNIYCTYWCYRFLLNQQSTCAGHIARFSRQQPRVPGVAVCACNSEDVFFLLLGYRRWLDK